MFPHYWKHISIKKSDIRANKAEITNELTHYYRGVCPCPE